MFTQTTKVATNKPVEGLVENCDDEDDETFDTLSKSFFRCGLEEQSRQLEHIIGWKVSGLSTKQDIANASCNVTNKLVETLILEVQKNRLVDKQR